MTMPAFYTAVADDFTALDTMIRTELRSDVPLVDRIARYIVESGGKRLRPLLVLLTSRALGYHGEEHIRLASIIEFLHTATLLHDDVVDTSSLRRGRSTANAKWGNAPSVLVGDFLYSRAFQQMVSIGSVPIMSVLADATNIIAEGEVLQLMNCKNPDVSEANYMDVIRSKTAMLFEASSHAAALLSKAPDAMVGALKEYGLHLGMAFQLIDDVLDYTGNAEEMGKNVGDDLAEGKPTLPLIQAIQAGNEADRKIIRGAIRAGGSSELLPEILRIVTDSGALDYTRERATEHAEKALHCLRDLTPSPYRDSLAELTHIAINRHN